MFKRIATSTLIVGAVMSLMPALASAEDFHRGRDQGRVESRSFRDRDNSDRREVRDRDDRDRQFRDRDRDRDVRFREDYNRGYYDRFGYWHWY